MTNQQIRFFGEMGTLEGNKSEIQIMRVWNWNHAQYGEFNITPDMLDDFIKNFQENKRGIDLAVDINHEPNHKAVWWIKKLAKKGGDAVFATVEWTKEGLELVKSGAYKYFSPELFFSFRDEESGETIQNLLVWGAITNRPFFKRMKALAMSETGSNENGEKKDILYFNLFDMSKKFSEIKTELAAAEKITAEQFEDAKLAFSELSQEDQATEMGTITDLEKKVEAGSWEDEKTDAEKEAEAKAKADQEAADAEAKRVADEAAAKAAAEGSDEQKEFSEKVKNEVGMTFAEIKEMQKQFAEMARSKKEMETKEKMNSFIFSEANPTGKIAKKSSDKFIAFASKLSDNLAAEFFEILNPSNFQTVELWEKGATGSDTPAAKFAEIAKKTPAGVDEKSFALSVLAKEFAEKEGLDLKNATIKAAKYMEDNKLA